MLALVWEGDGVSINRRYEIGFMNKGGKRIPILRSSDKYKAFIEDMSWTFARQAKEVSFDGPVYVEVVIKRRLNRGRHVDIDAYTKAIIDAIEHSGIIKNDAQVVMFSMDGTTAPVKKEHEEILVFIADGKFA